MLRVIKWPIRNLWGGFFIIIRTFGALALHKLIAVLYGPVGTTLLSHFQNFISLFTQPVQDVVGQGLLNAIPNNSYSRKTLYGTAIAAILMLFLATINIIALTDAFPKQLIDFSFYSWCVILLAILTLCFQSIASAILIANQKLKTLSLIHFVQWALIIAILSLLNLSIKYLLLTYLLILAIFTFIFYAFILSELKHYKLKGKLIDKKTIHHFKQFLWMGLAVWFSSKWVDFFMREYAIHLFGITETGYWQAVVRTSEAYRGLFISFLFITFFPTISTLIAKNREKVKSYLKTQMRYYFVSSFLFFLLLFLMHPYILELLYSESYLAGSSLFTIQIIGDFFAFLSFPLALVLMASLRTKAYVICEVLSAGIYVLGIYFGKYQGVEVLVQAHIVRFVIYFILVLFFTHKTLKSA